MDGKIYDPVRDLYVTTYSIESKREYLEYKITQNTTYSKWGGFLVSFGLNDSGQMSTPVTPSLFNSLNGTRVLFFTSSDLNLCQDRFRTLGCRTRDSFVHLFSVICVGILPKPPLSTSVPLHYLLSKVSRFLPHPPLTTFRLSNL